MRDVTVVGTEAGSLVLADDTGARYLLAVDDALRSRIRQAGGETAAERRASPREIQARIRAGLSAEEVASLLETDLDYVQRFEGPVIAEREFVLNSALAVPVHTAADASADASTFGEALRNRLTALEAQGARWASWKEPSGEWTIKLTFSAGAIEHDARWHFDPKKSALSPANNEAITLSQQGEVTGGLIPRLRAVDSGERTPDSSRFDSDAFSAEDLSRSDTLPHPTPLDLPERPTPVLPEAVTTEPASGSLDNTSDLLEALRRRRGERESANYDADLEDAKAAHPSTGTIKLVDVPLPSLEEEPEASEAAPPVAAPRSIKGRKGRAAMPSWDEIVFGTRGDDDPA